MELEGYRSIARGIVGGDEAGGDQCMRAGSHFSWIAKPDILPKIAAQKAGVCASDNAAFEYCAQNTA
jgi:hypothetical protein